MQAGETPATFGRSEQVLKVLPGPRRVLGFLVLAAEQTDALRDKVVLAWPITVMDAQEHAQCHVTVRKQAESSAWIAAA
jgi:hypothetical protein